MFSIWTSRVDEVVVDGNEGVDVGETVELVIIVEESEIVTESIFLIRAQILDW